MVTRTVTVAVSIPAALMLAACGSSGSASSSSTASSPAASSPTATGVVAFANCGSEKFGQPLAPLDPPADARNYSAPPTMTINSSKLYQATITTTGGEIVLCLQPELAPNTVNNFVTLARNKFYDGLTWHRVVPDFVIQGGDPTASGSGGPGYDFPDEPVRAPYVEGAVAMANSGPDTNGSQFFIDIADNTSKLQPLYNLFGKVESGINVAKKVKQGDIMKTVVVREQV